MPLESIRAVVADDLAAVDALIKHRLQSDIALITEIGEHIIHGGGKRVRPMLVLLYARACGYQGDEHIKLAATIEFIHTATLLHDDVVDASDLRRNRKTANFVWGNEASILVGDFLHTRAFQLMTEIGNMKIMNVLATATNIIVEGEVMQLIQRNDPKTSLENYMDIIDRKTARLFAVAAEISAILCDQTDEECLRAAQYGRQIGVAFQLIDDALDYHADAEMLGKNIGDDLAEGKATLPLIHALTQAAEKDVAIIIDAIKNGGRAKLDAIQQIVAETKALEHTMGKAKEYIQNAQQLLVNIAPSPYRDALTQLAAFTSTRHY